MKIMSGRKWNDLPLRNEVRPEHVSKGDLIEVVETWNFFRGVARPDRSTRNYKVGSADIYTFDVWEVAAIGKKIMRLVRRDSGLTFKTNIWTVHKLADGTNGFQGYIATLGNGNALAHELHETDPTAAAEMKVLTRSEAVQLTEF